MNQSQKENLSDLIDRIIRLEIQIEQLKIEIERLEGMRLPEPLPPSDSEESDDLAWDSLME